jgi:glucose-6-phosphate isomerase
MTYTKNFHQIQSDLDIFKLLEDEQETIGYYALPFQNTTDITAHAKTVHQKHIVVIGIGGSSLGASAIYDFLRISHKYGKLLHFLETTDPLNIQNVLDAIDIQDTHFVIISKSGTTIETIGIFKYVASLVEMGKNNCTIVSEADSKLANYANKHQIKLFNLAKDIGGRFSVFSVVGLVPLAMVGVDIDNLLNGCKEVHQSFFQKDEYYESIMHKARFLVENKNTFPMNVVFSYSSSLESFNKWYVQLWGESLGKIDTNNIQQGFTPIGLIGPIDQHSFLQLLMEGKRDKTVTFIKIDDFKSKIQIPSNTLEGFEGLNYIDTMWFSELLNKQADATIEAIQNKKDIPCDVISIETIDEHNIAKLMFSFQLLTSTVGNFLQIDTYNQPGVEDGKVILKRKLNQS